MEKRKNILCLANLLLFLVSFFLLTLNSFGNNNESQLNNFKTKLLSSKEQSAPISSQQQLSEENEVEGNDDFEIHSLDLPFLVSYIQFEVFKPSFVYKQPLCLKQDKPIYISVCNFRI